MANNSIITTKGKNILLYRAYTANGDLSGTEYGAVDKFQVGINNDTPDIADTSLAQAIPISDGVVNDNGDNQLTGSNGGDNTTDNTTTYKEGAGETDNTAQNLIANSSSATKTWAITDLSSLGNNITDTKYGSIWLYILDSTALNKFLSSGTAFKLKLGSDSSNYYEQTRTAAQLATGWNFIADPDNVISAWTEVGTVGAPIDYFEIEITTNNATDTFVAGDVIYDLLRTWDDADTKKDFVASFPTFDYNNNEVTIRTYITSLEANGFDLNGLALWNQDSTPLMGEEDTFTAESKSTTDEFTFLIKNRIL